MTAENGIRAAMNCRRDGRCAQPAGLCPACADRLARWLDELPGLAAAVADDPDADTPCCPRHTHPTHRPAAGLTASWPNVHGPKTPANLHAAGYDTTHPNPLRAGTVRPAAGIRVSGTTERPLPGGADRLSWLAQGADVSTYAGADHADHEHQTGAIPVAATLADWAAYAAETLGVHPPNAGAIVDTLDGPARRPTAADLHQLVAFLLRWHTRLTDMPWAADYANEIHTQWSTARRLAGQAEQWITIGRCVALDTNGDTCGEHLAAPADATVIRCPACGADWRREHWLLLGAAIDDEATA